MSNPLGSAVVRTMFQMYLLFDASPSPIRSFPAICYVLARANRIKAEKQEMRELNWLWNVLWKGTVICCAAVKWCRLRAFRRRAMPGTVLISRWIKMMKSVPFSKFRRLACFWLLLAARLCASVRAWRWRACVGVRLAARLSGKIDPIDFLPLLN